jgi:tetratricopeptide (TPR) repeat protein
MKKKSIEFTRGFLLLCILIFITSFFASAILFFWKSDYFCLYFGINSSCKASLFKGGTFDEEICRNNLKGLCFWHSLTSREYGDKKDCLIKKSCENGNQVSCFYNGLNLKRDAEDYSSVFVNSCKEGGVVSACYESGLMFLKTGEKNEAKSYFSKACNSGHFLSCILSAYESESDEDFGETKENIDKHLTFYRNAPSFKFVDKNGSMIEKEISLDAAQRILDNELGLFLFEASYVFFKTGDIDNSIYYLEKAVKLNKYDVFRIIESNKHHFFEINDKRAVSIITSTFKSIQKEIETLENNILLPHR